MAKYSEEFKIKVVTEYWRIGI